MQIKFNPHLPPGYFETHELGGLSWRSEKPVRDNLTERTAAQIVERFQLESRRELEAQRRSNGNGAVRRTYEVRGTTVEVVRHPWERIPSILIKREQEQEGGT